MDTVDSVVCDEGEATVNGNKLDSQKIGLLQHNQVTKIKKEDEDLMEKMKLSHRERVVIYTIGSHIKEAFLAQNQGDRRAFQSRFSRKMQEQHCGIRADR